jgi:hypothetical protein
MGAFGSQEALLLQIHSILSGDDITSLFLGTFGEIGSYARESLLRVIRFWEVGSSGLGIFFFSC